MTNAAIHYHPDAYDTGQTKLMGRQSAGESFIRGFIRHAQVDRHYFWNGSAVPEAEAEAMIRRIQPPQKPVTWIGRREFARLGEPGCLFVSGPANAYEGWNRRMVGSTRYSICGLTHTTASHGVMDAVISMLTGPVEPWDALICTSRAVTASVRAQLDWGVDYFRERFGPIRAPRLLIPTIPLGVNTADFARDEGHRAALRGRLGIGEDDIVVLYVGRFSPHAKMNPVPMAMALEHAARRTKTRIHWVLAGWGSNAFLESTYRDAGPQYAPSVTTHVLDGRRPDVRFPVWSAGDLFLSLSDNIQETFGLTPVEAMAAGLPSVISDWDGYRDLVEDGVQGFRVPTLAPRPGVGIDLALGHANGWTSYDHYAGISSQFVAPDVQAAGEGLLRLIENPDLRARMGAAAKARARAVFDWATVIPQYQALWGELARIRAAGAPSRRTLNPARPDPFALFAGYPTATLAAEASVRLTDHSTLEKAVAMLDHPTVGYTQLSLINADELATLYAAITAAGSVSVADLLAAVPPMRRTFVERSILWLAKFDLVRIAPEPVVAVS